MRQNPFILPGEQPAWSQGLRSATPNNGDEATKLMNSLLDAVKESKPNERLMHVNASLARGERYRGDLECIAALVKSGDVDPEEIFGIHDWLPGHIYLRRTSNWTIAIDGRIVDRVFPTKTGASSLLKNSANDVLDVVS